MKKINAHRCIAIKAIASDGTAHSFESIKDCTAAIGVHSHWIARCIRKDITWKGWSFEYINNNLR